MNQVSRPMQILLAATVVFAIAYFLVLKPGPAEEEPLPPVAAAPTTPAADAGGAAAESAAGKVIETANNAAADANAAVAQREQATGEEASTTPAGEAAPAGTTAPSAAAGSDTAAKTPAAERSSASERRAEAMVKSVGRDLKAGRVAVVLVHAPGGVEDKKLKRIITSGISRRGGKVRVYLIPASQIGQYEGLVGGLSLGQTPSTVVIAPDSTAKVLGGLTSVERIDRLTSSALRAKPAADPAAPAAVTP